MFKDTLIFIKKGQNSLILTPQKGTFGALLGSQEGIKKEDFGHPGAKNAKKSSFGGVSGLANFTPPGSGRRIFGFPPAYFPE
jgi:hypothetical protein